MVFKVSVRLEEAILDIGSYEAALRARLAENITRAAFEYVQASLSVIPVWSGASQSTFTELANAISLPLIVNPSSTAPDRTTVGNDLSSGELDTTGTTVSFVYETSLPHLIYNEFNNANTTPDSRLFSKLLQPGPYGFQQIAASAAKAVTETFVGPNINNHIKKRVIRKRVL